MGNLALHHHSNNHRKHVCETWNAIYAQDPQLLNKCITDAWLKAAELTPTWVWSLIDLYETQQTQYTENHQFVNIIQQVREFLHMFIKVYKADPEQVKTIVSPKGVQIRTHGFRLGARHRHYFHDGQDGAYWYPFAQQLPIFICRQYYALANNNNKLRRLLRIGTREEEAEEEEVRNAWRTFMNQLVEAMKRGYEGCPSEKTALRLSLTNSIISMASFRSNRSRSTSHFLDGTTVGPFLSPRMPSPPLQAPPVPKISQASSPPPTTVISPVEDVSPNRHYRSCSIFRVRGLRANCAVDGQATLRRLSSPNGVANSIAVLGASDFQLLRSANAHPAHQVTRRSLTALPP